MKTQIPVYRAKTLDGEWIEGFLYNVEGMYRIMDYAIDNYVSDDEIYPETLAIHLPDMIDINGERIFAALNESGVGGSLEIVDEKEWVWFYDKGIVCCRMSPDFHPSTSETINNVIAEVTGIYE
jgi:hypothetical protein